MALRTIGRLTWVVAAGVALGSCRLKSELYVDASTSPQSIQTVAVVPGSGSKFDHQIAARVWDQLHSSGIPVVDPRDLDPSPDISVPSVCRQAAGKGFQGVVFVDWNKLTLVNCETQQTAFQVAGADMNAPGVDKLTQVLVRYLRGESLQ
jgi:hypothetical protein